MRDANPIDTVDVQTFMFGDDGIVPNNPVLPVVLMAGALSYGNCTSRHVGTCGPNTISVLSVNGWGGNWIYTVFDYHHYHPNAHEALIAVKGWADLQIGGPGGKPVRISAGDAIVLPAGTGHCRVASSPDFAVCGGYPSGQENYEIVRATADNRGDAVDRIARVALPATDPVFGQAGPLLEVWQIE